MIVNLDDLEKFGFADPASAKGRLAKVRSRQTCIIIGVDYLVRIFVLYAWAGHIQTSRYRDKIISVYDEWRPKKMGIEANGMQVCFGDLVVEKAKEMLGKIRLIPIPSPTKVEKNFKIRTTIQPIVDDGRLFVPEDMIELRSELQSFPTGRFKDLVDTLAMAIMLIPRRTTQEGHDSEIEGLAKYLRDSGAPSDYIEQRIGEMKLAASFKREGDKSQPFTSMGGS